ncbi:hypothetical protein SNE40_021583 [Patella caerulea]|uniref:Uncharacterized protein n=1 Tax=Patella caerulea TaxID=87958 RepID=A0AAN8GJ01_PATCE
MKNTVKEIPRSVNSNETKADLIRNRNLNNIQPLPPIRTVNFLKTKDEESQGVDVRKPKCLRHKRKRCRSNIVNQLKSKPTALITNSQDNLTDGVPIHSPPLDPAVKIMAVLPPISKDLLEEKYNSGCEIVVRSELLDGFMKSSSSSRRNGICLVLDMSCPLGLVEFHRRVTIMSILSVFPDSEHFTDSFYA